MICKMLKVENIHFINNIAYYMGKITQKGNIEMS